MHFRWKFHKSYPTVIDLIGNTPLINLKSLSAKTGCYILAKLEYINYGGSSKDRFAKKIMETLTSKYDCNNIEIVEGSTGSTGISLAIATKIYNLSSCTIFMPSDQSREKQQWMELYGAKVIRVPPASFVNPENYVKRAQAYSQSKNSNHTIYYVDQFENDLNHLTHYETTGPEIWNQTYHQVDAVVLSAGTAGTISGVGQYLKEQSSSIKIILADPPGSGLYHWIKNGILYSPQEKEGTRRRHQTDSIVQGAGMNRLTSILLKAREWIDDAIQVSDEETIQMSQYLLKNEGLFIGSSSALNVAASVKLAEKLGPGHTIVTMLPDAGHRHWSSLYKIHSVE